MIITDPTEAARIVELINKMPISTEVVNRHGDVTDRPDIPRKWVDLEDDGTFNLHGKRRGFAVNACRFALDEADRKELGTYVVDSVKGDIGFDAAVAGLSKVDAGEIEKQVALLAAMTIRSSENLLPDVSPDKAAATIIANKDKSAVEIKTELGFRD